MAGEHEVVVKPFSDLHKRGGHVRATLLHDPTVEGLDVALYMDGSASMEDEYGPRGILAKIGGVRNQVEPQMRWMLEYLATKDRDGVLRVAYWATGDGSQIELVGDLSGAHAVRAIGEYLRGRELAISAFYTSNVEQYLFQFGTFDAYAQNVRTLPFTPNGVIIRSYFPNRRPHPQQVPGYNTVQVVQTIASFLDAQARGGYDSYYELVTRDVLELRRPAGAPR